MDIKHKHNNKCNLSNLFRGLTKDLLCAFISKMAHKIFTRRILWLPNIYMGNTDPDPWWPLLSRGQIHLSNFGSRSPKEQLCQIITRFVCIPARYHTFVEIDHEIISTVILLLPLIYSRRVVVSYKRKYVHKLLVNRLLKPAQEKVWLSELTVPQ